MPVNPQQVVNQQTVPISQIDKTGTNFGVQNRQDKINRPWTLRVSQNTNAMTVNNGTNQQIGFDTTNYNSYQSLGQQVYNLSFASISFGGHSYPYSTITVPSYGYYSVSFESWWTSETLQNGAPGAYCEVMVNGTGTSLGSFAASIPNYILPTPYIFCLPTAGQLTNTSTWSAVNLAQNNGSSILSLSGGNITGFVTGIYHCFWQSFIHPNAQCHINNALVYAAANQQFGTEIIAAAGNDWIINGSSIIGVTSGNTMTYANWQDSGAQQTFNADGSRAYMTVHLISYTPTMSYMTSTVTDILKLNPGDQVSLQASLTGASGTATTMVGADRQYLTLRYLGQS